jgi:carboxylesterase
MKRPRFLQSVTAASVLAALAIRRTVRKRYEDAHARRFTLGEDGIVRGAEPIALDASRTHAVLLLHGFNDTPQSMAPLAHALHRAGWTVRVPLLPGHGRSLRAMTTGRARDWLAHARAEYDALCRSHERVALCGLSMGGAIAVRLAATLPDLPALVLLAPFIGMPRDLTMKFRAAWLPQLLFPYRTSTGGERSIHDPEARAAALGPGVVTAGVLAELRATAIAAEEALTAVRAPTLYLQSREDNRIAASLAERNFARLGAATKEQRWFEGCGHIITVDYHREEVARQTAEWLARWTGAPS